MIETPELDKMLAVKVVGEFLDWLLNEKEYVIAEWECVDLYGVYHSTEEWLACYYNIDLEEVERERRAILEELRSQNGS